ncbi:MAG: IS110 family transposase, partial [Terriglobales bacterium]
KVTRVGLDIAKEVFEVHGVNENGKVQVRRQLRRTHVLEFFATLDPCLIGLETGSGAHCWARELQKLGHTVRLMAPRFVKPYRKNDKSDCNDAEAICEAVGRPNMRFVAVKSEEQQVVLSLHRIHAGLKTDRDALANRLRGLLAEFGIVLPKGAARLRGGLAVVISQERLPALMNQALTDGLKRLRELDDQVNQHERQIRALALQSEPARRLMAARGIGPMTATAALATIGDAKLFKNGRAVTAWLGMVPRHSGTGGKIWMGGITGRGDTYLRTLFIQGARSVMNTTRGKTDPLSLWVERLRARRGDNVAAVALGAKNARMVWAMLARGEAYRSPQAAPGAAA